jgi:hypothetical protein
MLRIFFVLLLLICNSVVRSTSTLRKRRGASTTTTVPPLIEVVESDWSLLETTTARPSLRMNHIDHLVQVSGDLIRDTLDKYGIKSNALPFVKENKVDPYGPFRKFLKTNLLDIVVIVSISVIVMTIAVLFK